ncbi:MAG: zinc ribbon domain-containing protein [Acidobacteriia bacterium]|nr:zinc ribbon domain-containing protein [Terriglobia bacterium]
MSGDLNQQDGEVLCRHCGQTLAAFLAEMSERNARVVCPACGKTHDHGSSDIHPSVTE